MTTTLRIPCALGVTIAAALVLSSCSVPGHRNDDRTLTVMLPTAAGLFVGNDVGVLGVPVGTVTAIEPSGKVVEVTLSITDDDLQIPADAGAAIVARSVAVDRYLEITPVYSGGPTMTDGAVIPVERTATPVEFDEVLGALKVLGDDLSNTESKDHSLSDLLEASDEALSGRGGEINQTIVSLSAALAEVSRQSPTIVGSLRSLTTLTTTLSDNESTVRRFIVDVADATDLLADERLNIGAAVRTLSSAIDAIGRVGKQHSEALSRDIRGLTAVLRATYRSRGDIAEIVETLPLAAQNIQRAVTPDHHARVQLDPIALTPISGPIGALCPALGPVCDSIALPPDLSTIIAMIAGRILEATP